MDIFFFFQAEDGIRDLVRSRGLGDVYKRQLQVYAAQPGHIAQQRSVELDHPGERGGVGHQAGHCLLYTSDAADQRSSVDLGGRRIINKKNRTIKRADRGIYIK